MCRQEGTHKGCLVLLFSNRYGGLMSSRVTNRMRVCLYTWYISYILPVHLCRYFEGYGVIRDIVHSHILQTIALLAMEPPISLDGEDIRNEKVCMHVIEHFNAFSCNGEKLLYRLRF